jgi:hypothetical protein
MLASSTLADPFELRTWLRGTYRAAAAAGDCMFVVIA